MQIEPITVVRSGKPGRPFKDVNREFLQEAMSAKRSITVKKLALILGIHRNTLHIYMNHNNVTREFHRLSDYDLKLLIKVCCCVALRTNIAYCRS
jgi:hypothetical protein